MSQEKTKLWALLKTTSFLFILSLFISCDSPEELNCAAPSSGLQTECLITEHKNEMIEELPLGDQGEVPNAALTFDTKSTLLNFSDEQKEKLIKATEIIKRVVASREFREGILNHTWQGKKQFVDSQGLTNAQIYSKILHASESYLDEKNNTLDVELELFFEPTKTIGYTYPNTKRIWMNKKYFDTYTAIQVSDNLFHEWLHKIGFDHSLSWSQERDHSVPYAIGYLVESLAHQIEMAHPSEKIGLN